MIALDFLCEGYNIKLEFLVPWEVNKMRDEPEVDEEVEKRKDEVIEKAKNNGHLLEFWKWDGFGQWRAWCQHRNCLASAWVSPNEPGVEPYGGDAISVATD